MNAITRHNYEEYFILYMDNELSAEERRSVEAFVQLHPDLHEELDILLQSKLEPDTSIQYEGKEELMFSNMNAISLSNYDEWLTLYIDNELQPEERLAVEQFVAQHPIVADELYILQQTKLPVETIGFPNKESLYRREEKERRIGWWKIAAAAAIVIGIVGTIIIASNNKKGSDKGLAGTNGTQNKTAPVIIDQPERQQQQKPQGIQQEPIIANAPVKNDDQREVVVNVDPKKNNATNNKQSFDNKKKDDVMIVKSNDLPKPLENRNVIALNDNNIKRNDYNLTTSEVLTKPTRNSANPAVTYATLTSLDQQTSLGPTINDGYDDGDQQGGKKNKFRGFLRKVTRTFEKTTNISATDDDDRLLVGGLAIRLK